MNTNKFLTLLCFLATAFCNVFAQSTTQSWTMSPANKSFVCPNEAIYYAVTLPNIGGGASGCRYTWTISGGVFPDYNNATTANTNITPNIDVVWNTTGSTGKLFLSTKECQISSSTTTMPTEFVIYLKTVSTETPTTNLTLPLRVQKGINEVTLTTNRVQVPNTGQWGDVSGVTTSIYADEYEWEIPANLNWYFRGTVPSNKKIRTSSRVCIAKI